MTLRRKRLQIWAGIVLILAILTAWGIYLTPYEGMAEWVAPMRSVKIEWSHWDVSFGTPAQTTVAYGRFKETPKLKCSDFIRCQEPMRGIISGTNVDLGNFAFDIPANRLGQVRTFINDSHTTCQSTIFNARMEAIGELCINTVSHKFLFYGVK